MPEPNLGKLIAVHSTSPAFLQRAAIVAGLSFFFFLIAIIFYLVWQSFLYFMLASGFLIVQLFTMIGWWMQRRNAVFIYANGVSIRGRSLTWQQIASLERDDTGSLSLVSTEGETLLIARSIHGVDRIEAFIRSNAS